MAKTAAPGVVLEVEAEKENHWHRPKEQATPDPQKAVPKWVGLMTIATAKAME